VVITGMSTNITEVAVSMVPVSDQDAAIAFYTQKLGFEVRADVTFGEGERWVEVAPPGSRARLAFAPPRGEFQPGRNLGLARETADVDADHAALREAGVDVDPEVMKMGGPVPDMFWFRDQDANVLLLVQAAPSA
jgi:catechol 2,3-dioxygenase-like lactoylglutathione lyase family enzyme